MRGTRTKKKDEKDTKDAEAATKELGIAERKSPRRPKRKADDDYVYDEPAKDIKKEKKILEKAAKRPKEEQEEVENAEEDEHELQKEEGEVSDHEEDSSDDDGHDFIQEEEDEAEEGMLGEEGMIGEEGMMGEEEEEGDEDDEPMEEQGEDDEESNEEHGGDDMEEQTVIEEGDVSAVVEEPELITVTPKIEPGLTVGPMDPMRKVKKKHKKCAVWSCESEGKPDIRYHTIPSEREPLKRLRWMGACKIDPNVKLKSNRICNEHFTDNDYGRDLAGNVNKNLKKRAIPSQNLPSDYEHGKPKGILSEAQLIAKAKALKRQELARKRARELEAMDESMGITPTKTVNLVKVPQTAQFVKDGKFLLPPKVITAMKGGSSNQQILILPNGARLIPEKDASTPSKLADISGGKTVKLMQQGLKAISPSKTGPVLQAIAPKGVIPTTPIILKAIPGSGKSTPGSKIALPKVPLLPKDVILPQVPILNVGTKKRNIVCGNMHCAGIKLQKDQKNSALNSEIISLKRELEDRNKRIQSLVKKVSAIQRNSEKLKSDTVVKQKVRLYLRRRFNAAQTKFLMGELENVVQKKVPEPPQAVTAQVESDHMYFTPQKGNKKDESPKKKGKGKKKEEEEEQEAVKTEILLDDMQVIHEAVIEECAEVMEEDEEN